MKHNKLLLMLAMFILVTPLVQALGVTPGRTTMNFKESLESEIKFTILNNEQKDLKLAIYATGDLADYIELPIKEVSLGPEESSRELSYKLKLPDKMEEPGLHGAEIIIREITAGKESKEISIGAMQAVITQLYVYVPYPGKYLVISRVDIVERKSENRVLFFVPIINFGRENINSAKAEITVMNMNSSIIDKVVTDEKPVPAGSRAELSSSMDYSKLSAGIYRVVVQLTYDGLTTTSENAFYTNDFLLIPLDISVRDFTLGDIARFNILIENIGNRDIKDAFSLMLLDSENNPIANIKSASADFKPYEKKEMLSYWDTTGVKEDEYTGKLVLKYEDRSDEKAIRTVVTKNEIKTEIIGITGYAIKAEGLAPEGPSTLIWVIIILLVMNIGWFAYYFLSGKRKNKQPPKETKIQPIIKENNEKPLNKEAQTLKDEEEDEI